jgi:signal transduction histidine kinase
MNDLGQALLREVDNIIESWVEQVRGNVDLDSHIGLTYEAVQDGLPDVLRAIAKLLTATFANQEQALAEDALEHGAVRADQGFEIDEVVREYRILRNVVLLALEPDLKTGSVTEVLRAVRKIDSVLDEAVLMSLQSYSKQRLESLEQMHGQLLLTNQELTRLVQMQKDNVSHLAHELKTPLNAIIGFSSIMLRQQRQQLTQEGSTASLEMQHIERVVNNGQQLLRLINNTLEVSRRESGEIALTVEPVNVLTLVRSAVGAFAASAEAKTLELTVECDRAPSQVKTDALRLQQILTNLVSNAIRYTDQGQIEISCYSVNDAQWAIAIRDTGKGIAPEDHAKIFEPYFRVGNEADYIPESSGLGLTIVNKLVQLLQGRIELISKVGEGTTFTVVLPVDLDQPVSSDATV